MRMRYFTSRVPSVLSSPHCPVHPPMCRAGGAHLILVLLVSVLVHLAALHRPSRCRRGVAGSGRKRAVLHKLALDARPLRRLLMARVVADDLAKLAVLSVGGRTK